MQVLFRLHVRVVLVPSHCTIYCIYTIHMKFHSQFGFHLMESRLRDSMFIKVLGLALLLHMAGILLL